MLKQVARKLLPQPWHASYYCPRYLNALVLKRTKQQVYQGPFKGLKYIDYSVASVYIPKLLGIYEQELHVAIERGCSLGIDHVIDIGAAEGYYAVGMALRLPHAAITAFETETAGQQAIAKLADLNDLRGRIDILGKCEVEDLNRALNRGDKPLIICDVEGYEDNLLDLSTVPSLAKAYILVELHEFVKQGLSEIIRERFTATHQVNEIWQEHRSTKDLPFRTFQTRLFPEVYIENELTEFRPERMSWFWMEPLSQAT
ncbi:MAG TPA: hypothetical protein DCK93_22045 [Blastocatellia bacterium]|jgi:hypothetical protein|nr:hypothetical protein [Blastocatellia bacterium]